MEGVCQYVRSTLWSGGNNVNYVIIIALVDKITLNPLHAKINLTLAIPQILYMLISLHLQVQKESKPQILTGVKFSEKTHIFSLLTHLLPKIGVKNGQIPPDSLTHPYQMEDEPHTENIQIFLHPPHLYSPANNFFYVNKILNGYPCHALCYCMVSLPLHNAKSPFV